MVLIAGPCVIEKEEACLSLAARLKEITLRSEIPLIFKSSYDKANRTSLNSYRGPGLERGLSILKRVKEELSLPILSDVHHPLEVEKAKEVLDIIQIPAFLCRQTDLILEASKSQRIINVKKGQFLSPYEVRHIIEKVTSTGN